MSGGQPPPHLGGPLGLVGLAMLAGATGIFVMAGSGGPAHAPIAQQAAVQTPAREKVAPVPELRPGDALPVVRPAELPASAETRTPAESKLAQISADGTEIVYIVQDFRLVGASYSGEIRLGYRLPPGLEPTRATINEIQSRIMQVDSVAYADPDYVAQPGKE